MLVPRSVKIKDELWLPARKKAGYVGISTVIRGVLKKWVEGEIELDLDQLKDDDDDEKKADR